MLLLIVPLLWAALWAGLAIVICAAAGIPPHDPRLGWYMGGIFVGGGIVLPAVSILVWTKMRKRRNR
ncbi:MAG TPA: hypothetical protein VFL45_04140 [Gammaproteobacteria bacterium]|nr:hypothetical protein [Gammaproteobacteria bacterium]